MKRIRQQCAVGVDANPDSIPHGVHKHHTKHGREVWCRGWFPRITTSKILFYGTRDQDLGVEDIAGRRPLGQA